MYSIFYNAHLRWYVTTALFVPLLPDLSKDMAQIDACAVGLRMGVEADFFLGYLWQREWRRLEIDSLRVFFACNSQILSK